MGSFELLRYEPLVAPVFLNLVLELITGPPGPKGVRLGSVFGPRGFGAVTVFCNRSPEGKVGSSLAFPGHISVVFGLAGGREFDCAGEIADRKRTRLNSSHVAIS